MRTGSGDRQRSFSFKPTRLPFLSFTIFFSLLFCFLFTISVLNYSNPSTKLDFTSGLRKTEIAAQGFAASISKAATLGETHIRETANSSWEVGDSFLQRESATLADTHFGGAADPSGEDPDSVWGSSNASSEDTHLGEMSKISEVAVNSLVQGKNSNVTDTSFRKTDGLSEEGGASDAVRLQGGTSRSDGVKLRNNTYDAKKAKSFGYWSSSNASGNSPASVLEVDRMSEGFCDVSSGRWVFDKSYPLYDSNSCPFIDEGFSCQANGRPDTDYMKWRWQPNKCNIPRFDAVKMLELIRGKRLVFVGDSINRNQWESILCLLRGGISNSNSIYEAHGRRITKNRGDYKFKFVEYQCSVEYYATHFLVRESKVKLGRKRVPTLRIDAIDRSSSRWRGADILVFNTAHWWSHYKTKAGVNYYQEGDQVHPYLDVAVAFRKALLTWASWVDQHVNPIKTQVFFRSSAPSHFRGGEWNSGGHCEDSTQPHNQAFVRSYPEKNTFVEQVLIHMNTPVTLLNVTVMSGLRIDGHPSIFGRNPGRSAGIGNQDCSHWCLPGVPDAWNEILVRRIRISETCNEFLENSQGTCLVERMLADC